VVLHPQPHRRILTLETLPQSDVCLYFLALFLPPLAVFFKTGCDSNFLINILLSILGWIPGVIRECLPTSLPI
jgi:uncharacterized membrane protein YqaE (UPF0057 family)